MKITNTSRSAQAQVPQAPTNSSRLVARLQWVAAAFLAVSFFLVLLLFALPFFMIRPAEVERDLVRRIETVCDGKLSYTQFRFERFPALAAEIHGLRLVFSNGGRLPFESELAAVHLNRISILRGRADISRVEMEGGKFAIPPPHFGFLKGIELEQLNLKLRDIRKGKPVSFELTASFAGGRKNISARGMWTSTEFEHWDWRELDVQGELRLTDLEAGALKGYLPWKALEKIKGGLLGATIQIQKTQGDSRLSASGGLDLKKLRYVPGGGGPDQDSAGIDLAADFEFDWNPEAEEFHLKKGSLNFPEGSVKAGGKILLATQEIQELRAAVSTSSLENIPQYFVPLKEALPLNLGFSGGGRLELSLGGTLDHLSIHGTMDLSSALLTYGRYFSKPREVPLDGSFDFLLKEAEILNGDFSVRIHAAAVKGTVADWDLQSGDGEINLLTNKFSLAGWEQLLPPLQSYQLGGETKILVHWRGELRQEGKVRNQIHWIVDHGRLLQADGRGLRRARFIFDYGDISIQLKQARFDFGTNKIFPRIAVYGYPEDPRILASLVSPRMDLSEILSDFKMFFSSWLPQEWVQRIEVSEPWIEDFFPPEQPFLENVRADLEFKKAEGFLGDLRFEAYRGEADLGGKWNPALPESPFSIDAEINRLNLARFLSRRGDAAPVLDGNFFLKAQLWGQKKSETQEEGENLSGSGEFSVTNGEWHTFDILGTVARIEEFSKLAPLAAGTTRFDDMRSNFVFGKGKIETSRLSLLSEDLSVFGDGEIFPDGGLNYRLNVFLEPGLAEQIVEAPKETVISRLSKKKKQLGPVPLLLSGPMERPRLEADPDLLPELREDLAKKKTQKVFRTFLPEDLFVKRPERPSSS